MEAWLNQLLAWVQHNPGWAGAAVFLVALGESLLVVGLIVPGTVLMFGIGALVGSGALGLGETLLWAFLGAVAGDGLSFWIGHHFRDRIRGWWPFNRHPEMLAHGEAFFLRHGGKSIFIGRFVGPVRPIIPAVAGMMGMSPGKFLAINILSAALWAPAYLLPGIAFGTSLALASQVAARLTVFLALVLGTAWLAWWVVTRLYRISAPRLGRTLGHLSRSLAAHPRLAQGLQPLWDAEAPFSHRLLRVVPVFIGIVLVLPPLVRWWFPAALDERLGRLFTAVATPWGDHWMGYLAALSSPSVLVWVALVAAAWWGLRRDFISLRAWFSGLGLTALGAALVPAGALLVAAVQWGMLAAFAAAGAGGRLRPWLYGAWAVLLLWVSLARLYLGHDRLSEVVSAVVVGAVLTALIVLLHRPQRPPTRPEVFVLALCAGLALTPFTVLAPQREVALPLVIAPERWWGEAWQRLPTYRIDLGGEREQPFTLQWGGTLEQWEDRLRRQGWQRPRPLDWRSLLNSFRATPSLDQLPVYPQLHDGRPEALILVRDQGPQRRQVLRLWPSRFALPEGGRVWLGYVAWQRLEQPLGFIALPRTESAFDSPRDRLAQALSGAVEIRRVRRAAPPVSSAVWDGEMLLLRAAGGER